MQLFGLNKFLLVLVGLPLLITANQLPFNSSSLLWGPYRPNLYFGIRPRLPKSLLIGLMWSGLADYQDIPRNLRHTCEQDEGMAGYGWTTYDTRTGGSQTIHDIGNNLNLTTEFYKISGGDHGGHWGLRVKGVPHTDAPFNLKTSLIFYVGMEDMHSGSGSTLESSRKQREKGYDGCVEIQGSHPGLGNFKLHIQEPNNAESSPKKPHSTTFIRSINVPDDSIWRAKSVVSNHIKDNVDVLKNLYGEADLPPPYEALVIKDKPGRGNLHFVQKIFEGSFEFDILFSSGSTPAPITSTEFTASIQEAPTSFSSRFSSVFGPKPPFNTAYNTNFSQYLFSNLIGGMGYFYGDGKIDTSYAPEYKEESLNFWEQAAKARARVEPEMKGPFELFSCVPSRPFFPRGFLWDEGFHLMPVLDWDLDLALDVVSSWFALMDSDGWIGREQILGPEARSKVPPKFQVQYPHYANPPTLFFIVSAFVDKLSGATPYFGFPSQFLNQPGDGKEFLADLYSLLKRHYHWFRTTQAGNLKLYNNPSHSWVEGYRWRGRTPQLTLTSGLDDYPRAQPPHPGELHVDAISWVGFMAGVLKKIATFLGETSDCSLFSRQLIDIQNAIEGLHWSEDNSAYCDTSIRDNKPIHVCHKGYVSLFPFLVGLLDPHNPHLNAILDLIRDESELWTPYGLRSLSRRSPSYGLDENYWRSPIWVNINYLVIERLLNLAQTPSPYQYKARKIYIELRHNLVSAVYNSWRTTGFAWEQYNPETGIGQRTQHFTGWTALIVKIMAFPDLKAQWLPRKLDGGKWNGKGVVMFIRIFALGFVLRRRLLRLWRSGAVCHKILRKKQGSR